MSSEIFFFFKSLLTNPAEVYFKYQQWTLNVDIFLKNPVKDSLVFFLKHISRTAVMTKGSVITCK